MTSSEICFALAYLLLERNSLVNFTVILRAAFMPIFFRSKKRIASRETLLYEKAVHKMLAKLTPNGTNSVKEDWV